MPSSKSDMLIIEYPMVNTADTVTLQRGVGSFMDTTVVIIDLNTGVVSFPSNYTEMNRNCLSVNEEHGNIITNSFADWTPTTEGGSIMVVYQPPETSDNNSLFFSMMTNGVDALMKITGNNGIEVPELDTDSKNIIGAINELHNTVPPSEEELAQIIADCETAVGDANAAVDAVESAIAAAELYTDFRRDLMEVTSTTAVTGVTRLNYTESAYLEITDGSALTVNLYGKNIFDGTYESKYLSGTSLVNGTPGTHFTTYPIVCGAAQNLIVSGNGTNRNRWCFYNSSMTAISAIDAAAVTTPANTCYFRCYYRNGSVGGTDAQIEIGSSPTAYEEYSTSVKINAGTSCDIFTIEAGQNMTFDGAATVNSLIYIFDGIEAEIAAVKDIMIVVSDTQEVTGIDRLYYTEDTMASISADDPVTVIHHGKNFFDGTYTSQYLSGTSLVDGGVGTHFTSNPIICGPGVTLTVSGNGHNRNRWCYYNAAMSAIGSDDLASITTPASTAYFRCYYRNGTDGITGAEVQMENSATGTTYEAYTTTTRVNNDVSCDMFDITAGDNLTFTGAATVTLHQNTITALADRLDELETYNFDDMFSLLSGFSETLMTLSNTETITDVDRLSFDSVVEIEITAAEVITVIHTKKNIFDGTYDAGKYLTGTALMTGSVGTHFTTNPIICDSACNLVVSGNGVNRNRWCFYDSSMTAISAVEAPSVTSPAGTSYFRCFYRNGTVGITGAEIQIEVGSTATTYEAYSATTVIDNDTSCERYRVEANDSITLTGAASVAIYGFVFNELNSRIDTLEQKGAYGIKMKLIDDEDNDYYLAYERVGAAAGLSTADFENIYPWSAMRLCNIKEHSSGAMEICYEDDESFALDGTNGNVMVEIPRHYVKRYVSDGYEYRYVSGTAADGFILDPVFIENGKELNAVYVGAYEGYIDDDTNLRSMSGVCPTGDLTRDVLRTYARNNGTGFGILDIRTLNTIQNLFMVEYASGNAQEKIGGGWTKMLQTGSSYGVPLFAHSDPNTVVIAGATTHEESIFFVGASLSIMNANCTAVLLWGRRVTSLTLNSPEAGQTTIVFDGPEVYVPTTYRFGSSAQYTGYTDELTTPSGKTANFGTDTLTAYRNAVRYRYMENLWGNMWHWLDGINLSNGRVYFCDDITQYETGRITSPYKLLPFSPPTQDSNASAGGTDEIKYVKNMSFSGFTPMFTIPISYINSDQTTVATTQTTPYIGTSPARASSYGDYYYFNTTADSIVHGGGWDHYWRAGLFCLRMWQDSTNANYGLKNSHWYLYGARLIYKPI